MRHYLLLVVGCLAVLSGIHHFARGQAPAVQRERWEYATLSFAVLNGTAVWGVNTATLDAAGKAEDVAARITGRQPDKKVGRRTILDAMGEQGWELVGYDGGRPPLNEQVYYFKRRG